MTNTMNAEPARNFLDGLRLGDPVTVHNVTMFPLLGEDRPGPAYTTLHRALASKTASVSEVSEGGSVPELLARTGQTDFEEAFVQLAFVAEPQGEPT